MRHERVPRPLLTLPAGLAALVLFVALGAVAQRLQLGLGATTNMSDAWPWGLWKAFNVLCLIALSAGGFTAAGLVYILGGERYHGFVRPAVLLALLGYGLAAASLTVDIGIPWRIVNPITMWSRQSLLFEVAWCVMLYLTVLGLELAPAGFQRFGWSRLAAAWRRLVPLYAVVALTFFTYVMSHSVAWAAGALALFGGLAVLLPRVGRRPSTPALLIFFGVILSLLHQSSLGSLFLLVPHKLSHFWWSPRLPVHFLLSAISAGLAVLVLERTASAHLHGRPRMDDRLAGLAGILAWLLALGLAVRLADVAVLALEAYEAQGLARAFGGADKAWLFGAELLLVAVLPLALLASARGRHGLIPRTAAAGSVALGVVLNRLNVCLLGMDLPGRYVPSPAEVALAAGALAALLLLYTLGVKLLPIQPAGAEPLDPHGSQASP